MTKPRAHKRKPRPRPRRRFAEEASGIARSLALYGDWLLSDHDLINGLQSELARMVVRYNAPAGEEPLQARHPVKP